MQRLSMLLCDPSIIEKIKEARDRITYLNQIETERETMLRSILIIFMQKTSGLLEEKNEKYNNIIVSTLSSYIVEKDALITQIRDLNNFSLKKNVKRMIQINKDVSSQLTKHSLIPITLNENLIELNHSIRILENFKIKSVFDKKSEENNQLYNDTLKTLYNFDEIVGKIAEDTEIFKNEMRDSLLRICDLLYEDDLNYEKLKDELRILNKFSNSQQEIKSIDYIADIQSAIDECIEEEFVPSICDVPNYNLIQCHTLLQGLIVC